MVEMIIRQEPGETAKQAVSRARKLLKANEQTHGPDWSMNTTIAGDILEVRIPPVITKWMGKLH
jgi:hypothetical protein